MQEKRYKLSDYLAQKYYLLKIFLIMTLILITNFSKKPKSKRFDKKKQKEDTFRCVYAPFAGRKKVY